MDISIRIGRSMRSAGGNRARSPQNQSPGQPPQPPGPPANRPGLGGEDNTTTRQSSTSTPPQTSSRSTAQAISPTQQASTRTTAPTISSTAPISTQQPTTSIAVSSTTLTFTASTTSVAVITPPISSITTLVTSTILTTPPTSSTTVATWGSSVSSSAQTSPTTTADAKGINSNFISNKSIVAGTVSAVVGLAVILALIFLYATRCRTRRKQEPTFDVYRRFSDYYRSKSSKLPNQEAPITSTAEPPVPALPFNVRSQRHYENLDVAEEKPKPNGFDKMRMRIAAVQELEENEARLREDQRANEIAEGNEKARWTGVTEWVRTQTKSNTDKKGLDKWSDKGAGDTRNSTARGTWYL